LYNNQAKELPHCKAQQREFVFSSDKEEQTPQTRNLVLCPYETFTAIAKEYYQQL
jgi:hypothetical protein